MMYLDKNEVRRRSIFSMVWHDIFDEKVEKRTEEEDDFDWDDEDELVDDWDDEEFDEEYDVDDKDDSIGDDYVIDYYQCSCGQTTSETVEPEQLCPICNSPVINPHLISIPKDEEVGIKVDYWYCTCRKTTCKERNDNLICAECGSGCSTPHFATSDSNENDTMDDICEEMDKAEAKIDEVSKKLVENGWGEVSPSSHNE